MNIILQPTEYFKYIIIYTEYVMAMQFNVPYTMVWFWFKYFLLVRFILMRVSCFQWKNILFIFMKTESLDKHTNTTTQPVHGTTNDKLKICVQLSVVRTYTSICTRKIFSKYLFNKYENHFGSPTSKFSILYYSRFM